MAICLPFHSWYDSFLLLSTPSSLGQGALLPCLLSFPWREWTVLVPPGGCSLIAPTTHKVLCPLWMLPMESFPVELECIEAGFSKIYGLCPNTALQDAQQELELHNVVVTISKVMFSSKSCQFVSSKSSNTLSRSSFLASVALMHSRNPMDNSCTALLFSQQTSG